MMGTRQLEALMGHAGPGVVWGFDMPDVGALTLTYSELIARIMDANGRLVEYRIAGTTKVVTATKDTYAYVDGSTGAIAWAEVANLAEKPKIGGGVVPARSLYLAKVIAAGTVTSVTDLRQFTGNIQTIHEIVSYETTEVGDTYIKPGCRARVIGLDSTVIQALAATDAGTVTPYIVNMNGTATAITDADISHAASAAAGIRDIELASITAIINPMDQINLTSAKADAGGLAQCDVILEVL